ncbi:MAG: glycosyltransferase family 4 protein [Gammaproteobacteria bacterium]
MKLLFCLFTYNPYSGLQRDCVRVAKACIARGDEVEIITQIWQGPRIPGIKVHCHPMRGWTNHQKSKQFAEFVLTFIKQHHYDGVVGFDKMPGLDIYYAAAAYRPKAQGWKSLLPREKIYETLQQAVFSPLQKTRILLLSRDQQAIFMQHYGTQAERFYVLPPGVDRNRSVATLRNEKLATDPKIVLFIGSSFRNKGLKRALYALSSLPEDLRKTTQLWIVGDDSLFFYHHLIKQLNLKDQIKFIGASENVPELLRQADLLLHPAHLELTGTVLLEALVAGVPVLTTQACGYAHYVEESVAGQVIHDPFSQEKLNTAFKEILAPTRLHDLQEKAYNFSQTADVYRGPEVAAEIIHEILT